MEKGLSLEQLQKMGATPYKGMTAEQLQSQGATSIDQSMAGLAHSQSMVDQMTSDAAQAKAAADVAQSQAGIAQETAKGTAGGILDTGVKFVRSALEAPMDIFNKLRGGEVDTSARPGFGGDPQKTFQGEMAADIKPAVEAGTMSPLEGTARSVGDVVAGAADILGAKGGAEMLKKPFTAVQDYLGSKSEKAIAARTEQTAIKALTPKMTPTEMIEAGKSGKTVKPRFGAPRVDMSKDKGFAKQVEAVKGLVQGKSAIKDTNSVRDALSKEAEALKSRVVASGSNRIYSFKKLSAKISAADEPISLRGTPFEKQIVPIKKAAIEIAQKNGGTISSLFDTRKEFDQLVEKTYPNLYDSENAPMRNAITAVRNTMNDFIEANLPEGTGFKDSLAKQKTYYDAIDNISSKIPDEIKGGATFGKRHPLIKSAAKYGAAGAAGAVGFDEAKRFIP